MRVFESNNHVMLLSGKTQKNLMTYDLHMLEIKSKIYSFYEKNIEKFIFSIERSKWNQGTQGK